MEVVLTGRLVKEEEEHCGTLPIKLENPPPPCAGRTEEQTAPSLPSEPALASAAPTDEIAERAEGQPAVIPYQWQGKWYFRGNKNKSSTFAYQVSTSP